MVIYLMNVSISIHPLFHSISSHWLIVPTIIKEKKSKRTNRWRSIPVEHIWTYIHINR